MRRTLATTVALATAAVLTPLAGGAMALPTPVATTGRAVDGSSESDGATQREVMFVGNNWEGTADVIDGEEIVAGPGHSIDVPEGSKHRLCNNSSEELVIIEVQRGAYTGEDDIQRYDDDYGRETCVETGQP